MADETRRSEPGESVPSWPSPAENAFSMPFTENACWLRRITGSKMFPQQRHLQPVKLTYPPSRKKSANRSGTISPLHRGHDIVTHSFFLAPDVKLPAHRMGKDRIVNPV